MYLKMIFPALPEHMEMERLKLEVAELIEERGWLIGSGSEPDGGFIEVELEEDYNDPKFGIIAMKRYFQQERFAKETVMELAGIPIGLYE